MTETFILILGAHNRSVCGISEGKFLEKYQKEINALQVAPHDDTEVEPDIQAWLEKYYSIRWRNYPVDLSYLTESSVIPARNE